MSPYAQELVGRTLSSGFIGQGDRVEEFEALLREWFGNEYVNTVNSGTSGLQLALRLCESDRDEVISTPLTCTATNWAILAAGLKIRWADVDPTTCNIDPKDVARKVGPNTAAIMAVHWGGQSCDLDSLAAVQCRCESEYGFRPPIIEDAAHAWGAKYRDKLIGNHGNFTVFSFQAIKHFTTGDGGAILCPDLETHQRAKLLRWYGLDRTSNVDARCSQDVAEWGYKFHMNDINASIGIRNLPLSRQVVERHKENGRYYDDELRGVPGVLRLRRQDGAESSYWIYTMRVANRDGFVRRMRECGVAAGQVHSRNDRHRCVRQFAAELPGMDELDRDMICIPCGWWLTDEDREYIVKCIREGW